jgi:hypothetical protein
VQVDPIKPALKGAGTKRLKLKYHKLLSNFPFKFNLRRYSMVSVDPGARRSVPALGDSLCSAALSAAASGTPIDGRSGLADIARHVMDTHSSRVPQMAVNASQI